MRRVVKDVSIFVGLDVHKDSIDAAAGRTGDIVAGAFGQDSEPVVKGNARHGTYLPTGDYHVTVTEYVSKMVWCELYSTNIWRS